MKIRHVVIAKHILALSAVLLGFSAQAQSIAGPPFMAVHGKAKAEIVPDIFPLKVVLEDTSLDTARTEQIIEDYARQIISLSEAMKMAEADVDVSNLSVSPVHRYDDDTDEQVFLGNRYRREIGLRFHTLAGLKAMIESLPQAKQVQISTENFKSSRQDELRRNLLAAAVQDARQTADAMAEAVGRRIGAVHNISNQGFNVRYVASGDGYELDSIMVTGARYAAAAAPPRQVALQEGSIQLDQDVYIIYTLVD